MIVKETKNHYKIAKTQVNEMLQGRIQQEHGDTVVVTRITDAPDDASFYLIETE